MLGLSIGPAGSHWILTQTHALPLPPTGVALLANAPERVVERRRRPRDSPILSNSSSRVTSRVARHRSGLPTPEEQPTSQRVSHGTGTPAPPCGQVSPLPPAPQDRLSQVLRDLEDESTPIVKLGDASIAAPFTSKLSSIQCSESCHPPHPPAHPSWHPGPHLPPPPPPQSAT